MNNLSSKIFVFIFVLAMIISTPYIANNYIMKQDENNEFEYDLEDDELYYYDDDEYSTYEEEQEIEENSDISSDVASITNNIAKSNHNNTVNKSNSNKVTKKVSNSNKKVTKTSNSVKKTTSNKTVKKSNSYTRVNSVNKPPMTYTSFKTVGKSYFDDALFIGDSRTEGLRMYGSLKNATYFSTVGMSTYSAFKKTVSVKGVGSVTLKQLLNKKKFKKVYIMLGINEVGGNANSIASKYGDLINLVRSTQPDAIIYIEGNLHVAKSRNDRDKSINNNRINNLNAKMASYANNKDIIYIDINYLFDDEDGNLKSNMTGDATHVYGKYYKDWCNWLMQHAAS